MEKLKNENNIIDGNLNEPSSNEGIISQKNETLMKSNSFFIRRDDDDLYNKSYFKDSKTSNLNNLFRESILLSNTKRSNRNSFFRQSLTKEKNSILNSNEINENDSKENNEKEIQFDNFVYEKLSTLKNNFNTFLNDNLNKIEEKYSQYILFIDNYIQTNENKLNKIGKSSEQIFINYADRTIFKQIDLIIEIIDNLFESIKDNISLLSNFINDTSLIFEKNPLEKYINNNSQLILDSFILSKIDFQKLNLTNLIDNKILKDICLKYFSKKKENTCSYLDINKPDQEKLQIESEFLKENYNNLQKLKLKKIDDSQNSIFSFLQQNTINQIEVIKINKCKNFNLEKFPNCPNLFKFSVKKTQIQNMFIGENLNFTHLEQIKLRNCNLNDKLFYNFFSLLSKNPEMQNNLEVLDLSNNLIGNVNLKEFVDSNNDLNNLKLLDLSHNFIYLFSMENFGVFRSIKVLDLSNNNITTSLLFEGILERIKTKKLLALLSLNLFVSNNKENCEHYKKYLFDFIQHYEFETPKLVFSLLLNKNNCSVLQDLKLSPSIKLSLKSLNLSCTGLTSEIAIKFFQGNYGLFNLKKLNLSYNLLTNKIFSLYISKNENEELKEDKNEFKKLYKINLSFNEELSCESIEDLDLFYNFIYKTPSLKKMTFYGTKFEKDYLNLFKNNAEKINKLESKISNQNLKFVFQKKIFTYNTDILKLTNLIKFENKEF